MHFILLTHSRELAKLSGTGQLIHQLCPEQCTIIEWSRINPDQRLTKTLDINTSLLIYPVENANENAYFHNGSLSQFSTFIIIDGTWQEAKKIYNRSPYLHKLMHYELQVDYSSKYQLRRNQKEMGLCTAEVAIEIMMKKNQLDMAQGLNESFQALNQSKRQTRKE